MSWMRNVITHGLQYLSLLITKCGVDAHSTNDDTDNLFHNVPYFSAKHMAMSAVMVVTSLIAMLVCLHWRRKRSQRNMKEIPRTRYHRNSLDLFEDPSSNGGVLVRNNSMYLPKGPDASGYYQNPTPNRNSGSGLMRVPSKQLFRGNIYSGEQINSNGEMFTNLGQRELANETTIEESMFVY